MKKQNISPLDKAALLFLSFFGTGYSPKAPGTVGSLAAIPFIFLFAYLNLNIYIFISIIIITTIIACIVTDKIQKKLHLHDPGWIVIDEVIGMLITWCFVYGSTDLISISATFITFRFFDIIKFWPASYFDKNVQHGAGTILDDVLSAIYAGISTLIVKNFLT